MERILNNNMYKRRNYEFEDTHAHSWKKSCQNWNLNRIEFAMLHCTNKKNSVPVGSESAHITWAHEWTDSIVSHRSKWFFNNRRHQISSIDNGFVLPCTYFVLTPHAACIYILLLFVCPCAAPEHPSTNRSTHCCIDFLPFPIFFFCLVRFDHHSPQWHHIPHFTCMKRILPLSID